MDNIEGGPSVLYIDRHMIHEVTSPQAFAGLKARGIKVRRPDRTVATADHNIPTLDQHLPIQDELSRFQVNKLKENCAEYNVPLYGLNHPYNGIVHVIGPELGLTQPGMTIVCGDSHTSTHGAFGSIAFGIGTSEVEMVLATQCLMQSRPKTMRINIEGQLRPGVVAKDIVLYIISKLTTGGGTGYFVEFAGSAIRSLSMEGRMTICNMSIEMGARGGMIAPDETTIEYVKGREFAPKGKDWDRCVAEWRKLPSDPDAKFDKELTFDAADIEPMITYGTNPGMGIGITKHIPKVDDLDKASQTSFVKSLEYMNFNPGEPMLGKKVDYVFVGSCTNGRIEDLRQAAEVLRGRKVHKDVRCIVIPATQAIWRQANDEGLFDVFLDAEAAVSAPTCGPCLGGHMGVLARGERAVSTTNRNFVGRMGDPGSEVYLAGPYVAAASAVAGYIATPEQIGAPAPAEGRRRS